MTKRYLSIFALATLVTLPACLDDYLTTEPQTLLTDEQVWTDAALIRSVLADLYDRIPRQHSLENWGDYGNFDEGMTTGQGTGGAASQNYGFGSWGNYGNNDWDAMRDLHVAMAGIEATSETDLPLKSEFLAELRFIRAQYYFEKVKRHGGVPLITEQLLYDFSGDPTSLHTPRATEAATYDFIYDELQAIKDQLGNAGSETRANKQTALALLSRAMLYAGSIAQHNYRPGFAPITLPGGEVGIPQARANEYYTKSLDASRELIQGGTHSLLTGANPTEAFHNVFVTKNHNEVIFARDYLASQGRNHWFTMRVLPQSMKVEVYQNWGGSEMAATLNVAENFDYLDGSSGELRGVGDGSVASQANWIFYDEMDDIFEDKDRRLEATLLVPGGTFGGEQVQLQAGVYRWNEGANRYDRERGTAGTTLEDDGLTLTGTDGPVDQTAYINATGFIKKYLDPAPSARRYSPGAETWWVYYRLGEIYMNATEAAFALGLMPEALGYINTLRERAGFPPNSLTTLTLEKIQSERWAELAYEDHRLWDLRRWRIAHEVWDGDPATDSARLWVLFPYRVYRPGHANHNKYVFDRFISTQNTVPRFFRMGNYYSTIPQGAINNNPLLVANPFHD